MVENMTQESYYLNKVQGKSKKHIQNIQHFRETLYDIQPSMIWWDEFSEDIPYIEGSYSNKQFRGAYVGQSLLTFELDSLSQLESVFKEGVYIYV